MEMKNLQLACTECGGPNIVEVPETLSEAELGQVSAFMTDRCLKCRGREVERLRLMLESAPKREGISDKAFANELIRRLNLLLEYSPEVGRVLKKLLCNRVCVTDEFADHPTIQCVTMSEADKGGHQSDCNYFVRMLGILNGLAGVLTEEGPKKGMGLVAAEYDLDTDELVGFTRTDSPGIRLEDERKE